MHGINVIFVIIILLSAGCTFYGLLHILRQLRMPWRSSCLLALGCSLLSAAHQFMLQLGNYNDISTLHPLFYLSALCANFGILALPLALFVDIFLSIIRLIKGPILTSAPLIKWRKRYGAVALCIVTACSAVALYNAQALPQLDRNDIYITDLHSDLEGLTIAQVSDVHASPFFTQDRSHNIAAIVQSAHPDLIVFTGDQVDGTPEQRDAAMQPFVKLQAPLGVYFIPGNHEYITGMRNWLEWYQHHNLNLLLNAHVTKNAGQARISIVGLDDMRALSAGEQGFNGPNLPQALAGIAEDDFRLLLAHQPRLAPEYANPQYGIDLMLSGHTHGGQVPILSALTKAANLGFLKGLYQIGTLQLYVSEGTGLWQGFCARLGTHSQITLFTLKRAQP